MQIEVTHLKELDPKGGPQQGVIRFSLSLFGDNGERIAQFGGFRYDPRPRENGKPADNHGIKNQSMRKPGKGGGWMLISSIESDVWQQQIAGAVEDAASSVRRRIASIEAERGRQLTLDEQRHIWTQATRVIWSRPAPESSND